jgi:hypothetical protein
MVCFSPPYTIPPTPPPYVPPTPPGGECNPVDPISGVSMSTLRSFWWYDGVSDICNNRGVSDRVWGAIMYAESGGYERALNYNPPIEISYGLFQLNTLGGQGQGYTEAQLYDPYMNATIAMNSIAPANAAYPGNIRNICRYSGHPGEVDYCDYRLNIYVAYYNALV